MDARDEGPEMAHSAKTPCLRDRSLPHNPANSGLFTRRQELLGSARLRGGGPSLLRTCLCNVTLPKFPNNWENNGNSTHFDP